MTTPGTIYVDFSKPILDQKNKEIKEVDNKGKETADVMTLQSISETALLATFADERDLSAEDKVKRYKLFNKINSMNWELKAKEVELLKLCLGKMAGPLVVGRAYDIIEPEKEEEKKPEPAKVTTLKK